MPKFTLKVRLRDWTDWNAAMYDLGLVLGFWTLEEHPFTTPAKHVMWSKHGVGTLLANMLMGMVDQGMLERRDEPDQQFRWNAAYRGTWEKNDG